MKLKQNLRAIVCASGLFAAGIATAAEEPAPPPSAPPKRSAAELEKLVAPIALHPDPLVSIILPASVYPLEIVQAARFVKDTNNLSKVDAQPWDANVKSLAKFPEMIAKMDADLSWTTALGEAFLEQQKEVMDTIQSLRAKANSAGVLKTTPQQVIIVTNTVIEKTVEQKVVFVTNTVVQIQPANPQVVYVPTYPPTIYYPAPVYAGPPPLLTFAAGVAVGAIIANNCDWHGGGIYVGGSGFVAWGGGGYHNSGDVNIKVDNSVNIDNSRGGNTVNNSGNKPTQHTGGQKWQPDQNRVKSSGSTTSAKTMESRGWGSGSASAGARPGTQPATGNRGGGATAAARPSPPSGGTRPSTPSAATRPSATPSTRPSGGSPSAGHSSSSGRPSASPSASRSSAFSGGDRQASQRGAASRGGGGASRGGGGASRGGGGGGGRGGGGGGR